MKKVSVFLAFIISALLTFSVSAQDVRVYVNGNRVNENVILSENRTYVPLRAVSEALGAEVEWDDASRSVYITFKDDDIIANVVKNASPSVVTIVGNYDSDTAAVKYNNPTVHGSGVIYKSNGYIITNAHVVESIKNLTVILNDGTKCAGKVLCSDEKADLAIIKIDKIGLAAIRMAKKESIVTGRTAIAIGTPVSMSLRNTVTKGIISGNGVSLSDAYYKLIQTDAAINPGNSGGPLLNVSGELIGINSSKFVNASIDNIGFAIPVDTVEYFISQYEKYGNVKRAAPDLTLEESWEAKIGLPTDKGLTVKRSGYPEIAQGDTVVSVNGVAVHSQTDVNEALKDTFNGEYIDFGISDNGNIKSVKIYL